MHRVRSEVPHQLGGVPLFPASSGQSLIHSGLHSPPGVHCPGLSVPTPSAGRKTCVPSSGPPDQRVTSTAPRSGMSSPTAAGECLPGPQSKCKCKCVLFLGREAEGVCLLLCLLFGSSQGQDSQERPLAGGGVCPSVRSTRSGVCLALWVLPLPGAIPPLQPSGS